MQRILVHTTQERRSKSELSAREFEAALLFADDILNYVIEAINEFVDPLIIAEFPKSRTEKEAE
jgi:hypothetical protein